MSSPPARLSHADLFLGFFSVGIQGFGGVLPLARRMVVEQRRWLSQEQFNDLFALCQTLPGANITNFSAVFGYRQRGITGMAAALGGLLGAPVAIVLGMAALYARYGALPVVHHALAGMAAVAAGQMLASAAKIAKPVLRVKRNVALAGLVLLGVLALHLPLLITMALVLPVSLYIAWRTTP